MIEQKQSNDGGPAFPSDEYSVNNGHWEGRYEIFAQHPGMTLRDWFAGQALAGMLADPNLVGTPDTWALGAYDYADAMLKARKR